MTEPKSETKRLFINEYLMHEGQESKEMYYLQSGSLAIFKKKADRDVQIGTIMSGELVGEMSFLDGKPRSATVKALQECVLVVVPREKYEQLMETHPKWFKALLNTLLDRLRKANARVKI
jgi:CRP-like cAMP-binding protein